MFCQYCGNEHNDDAVFCPKCGKRIHLNDEKKEYQNEHVSKENSETNFKAESKISVILRVILSIILGIIIAIIGLFTLGSFMYIIASVLAGIIISVVCCVKLKKVSFGTLLGIIIGILFIFVWLYAIAVADDVTEEFIIEQIAWRILWIEPISFFIFCCTEISRTLKRIKIGFIIFISLFFISWGALEVCDVYEEHLQEKEDMKKTERVKEENKKVENDETEEKGYNNVENKDSHVDKQIKNDKWSVDTGNSEYYINSQGELVDRIEEFKTQIVNGHTIKFPVLEGDENEIVVYEFDTYDNIHVIVDATNVYQQTSLDQIGDYGDVSLEIVAPGRDIVYMTDGQRYYIEDYSRNLLTITCPKN